MLDLRAIAHEEMAYVAPGSKLLVELAGDGHWAGIFSADDRPRILCYCRQKSRHAASVSDSDVDGWAAITGDAGSALAGPLPDGARQIRVTADGGHPRHRVAHGVWLVLVAHDEPVRLRVVAGGPDGPVAADPVETTLVPRGYDDPAGA
jgi:hypothetical protein